MSEAALLEEIQHLKQRIDTLRTANENLTLENAQLAEQVQLLRHLHFGTKSEKLTKEDKLVASLFNEAEDTAFSHVNEAESAKVLKETQIPAHKRKAPRKEAGRTALSANLPREEVEYDLSEAEKTCDCGTKLSCIGEDVTERLKIIPAKAVVLREKKKKYVCRHCEGLEREDEKGVVTAKSPVHLIPASLADESFLSWSISEKFEFALPFYRQAIRLKQIGAPIPRATLSNLTVKTGTLCKPLYALLEKTILSGEVINADETRVQVLKEPGRKNQTKSWMWVFLGGPPGQGSVIFRYDPGRTHEVPYTVLKSFRGYLQTDDFGAYHTALKKIEDEQGQEISHVLCWAHARRQFYTYWHGSQDASAKEILDLIGRLFELEDLRKHYSRKGFVKYRKLQAAPVFNELFKKLTAIYPQVPPSLEYGKAIAYTLDNWEQLIRYVEHFGLSPSNNAAERAIRPFVIGRKNWQFCGSPAGAESSAILYSLVESAKLHNLAPFEYLYYVFQNLPICKTENDYAALLPFNIDPGVLKAER